MLAQSYDVNSDGRPYPIQRRQGMRFDNGQEMAWADVVASINRWGKGSSRGRIAFQSIESVTATGCHTVVLKLKTRFAPLLPFLAFQNSAAAIYPKAIVDKFGEKVSEYVGPGP